MVRKSFTWKGMMTKMASKTKMNFIVYNKDGKDYLGYNSHPLLADSDGDGLADGEDDNKKEWYVTDRDSLLYGVSLSRR